MKFSGPTLGCLLLGFASLNAMAALQSRRGNETGATTWIRTADDGRFTLDEIGVDVAGWPVLLSHRIFTTAVEADRAARRAGFFGIPTAPLYAHDENTARELRFPNVKPLWEIRNEWSTDWEMKYGEWVEKNIDRDFFVHTNQPSDCADLAYAARWIFARENGLPMANRLSGTGDYFTQRSVKPEWMLLPTDPDWTKDRRFRAALDYLLAMTYTHTLMGDSYPVALDPTTFRAGIHHLSLLDDSGHTLLIHRTDFKTPGGLPFLVLYSTLPIVVRQLAEQAYFYSDQPKVDTGGFLRMRWPIFSGNSVTLRKATNMPGYSLEQYDPKFMDGQSSFGLAVMRKLKPTFSLVTAMRSAIDGVRAMIQDRVKIVEDGFALCSKAPGGCPPTSADYENWSTPSRDARILAQTKLVTSMASLGNADEQKQMDALEKTELKKPVIDLGGESLDLNIVYQAFRHHLASADPNQPIELRWGARPEALTEIFRQRIQTGYRDRAAAMASAGTTCLGNPGADCAPGGLRYLQENSFELDTKLKEPALLESAYCRDTGERDPKCVRLRSQLATTQLTIGSETKSLREWIDASLELNSDPRVSLDRRNGREPLPYAKLEITGAHEFRLRAGVAFVRDRASLRGKLYDRRGNGFIARALPAGLIALDASLADHRGLFARGNRLVFADLNGAGEAKVFESTLPVLEGRLLGKATNGRERVLVFTERGWRLLESNGSVWTDILSGAMNAKASLDPKFDREMLVFQTGANPTGGWSLVDLRAARPAVLPFDGVPSADNGRHDYALARAIYLQVTQLGPNGEILRTIRVDRARGTLGVAWGLRSYVGHVTNDDRLAYFGDKVGDVDSFYRAEIDADGKLGPRERLAANFYRQLDYVIFYGGVAKMVTAAIGPDGNLVPVELQPGEQWFKHIRGDSIVALMKDGDYGIRKVSGGGTILQDGFLGMPLEGSGEIPYRFLVRHWKTLDPTGEVPATSASLTDASHPERFAIQTGMLLGDSYEHAHEPWSVDGYDGVDAVDLDAGTVINAGSRAYWIGD